MTPFEADILRYRNDYPRRRLSTAALLTRRAGLQVIAVYRLGQWLRRRRNLAARIALAPLRWLVYAPVHVLLSRAYGIELADTAEIGPGLYVGHGGGVELRQCVLGGHCSIAQQTKVGPAPGESEGPSVGSRVWIGAHAHVRGRLTVGDGATIAAGAHVSRDVPPRTLVAGNPARVIRWGYDNSVILGDGPPNRTAHLVAVDIGECEPDLG